MPKMGRLGSGKRFASGKKKLMKKGYSAKRAGAILAAAGRKKYGKKRFQDWAVAGRKRAAKRRRRSQR